eukprot:jgi/Ulvmu1/4102/UM019_0081.1
MPAVHVTAVYNHNEHSSFDEWCGQLLNICQPRIKHSGQAAAEAQGSTSHISAGGCAQPMCTTTSTPWLTWPWGQFALLTANAACSYSRARGQQHSSTGIMIAPSSGQLSNSPSSIVASHNQCHSQPNRNDTMFHAPSVAGALLHRERETVVIKADPVCHSLQSVTALVCRCHHDTCE